MTVISINHAQNHLAELLADVTQSHQAVHIQGQNTNGVLLAEEDWQAIQETLYLLSVPGMRESIRDGMETPLMKCENELVW